jgi:hypothetical protein
MKTQEKEKAENHAQNRKHAVQPSGYDGKNPAGPGDTAVHSLTAEIKKSEINPSAPNDVNRTPDRQQK